MCTGQLTGPSFEWYEHVVTVNNTKVKKFTYYKHHLLMINFIFVNFYKNLNFHNIVGNGKSETKVLLKNVKHNN